MSKLKKKRNITFRNLEVRSIFDENENKKYCEGIIPYNSKSVEFFGITEIIGKTAFNKTLKDNAEVRALINHNENWLLGNTKSGTLILEDTDEGLIFRCELPNTSYANDVYEVISRGDVSTCSFGFVPIKWQDDDRNKTRTLKEVKLVEVSVGVSQPAYPDTNSVAYMRGLEKMEIDIEKLNETLEKEELSDDDNLLITQTINVLTGLLPKAEPKAVENEQTEVTQPIVDTQSEAQEEERKKLVELQIEAEIASTTEE